MVCLLVLFVQTEVGIGEELEFHDVKAVKYKAQNVINQNLLGIYVEILQLIFIKSMNIEIM